MLPPTLLEAQDAGSVAGQLWKDANSAFATKDYDRASADLQKIITLAGVPGQWMSNVDLPPASPKQQWLEAVFFMMGASYFNAKDWPSAIATFKAYRKLFPNAKLFSQITFSLAQSDFIGGEAADSIPLFTSLLPDPTYHVKAIKLIVEANKKIGKPEDSITLLEKEKTTPNLDPDYLGKIDTMLCDLYLDANDIDKAMPLIVEMDGNINHLEDVTRFNLAAVRLGDELLAQQRTDDALSCYRRVRDNQQILDLQNKQIDFLKRQRAANLVRIEADPLNSSNLQLENNDIDVQEKKDEQILVEYQTLPPVQPPLYLRIGQVFTQKKRLWEAAVIYREILRRYPTCAEAEGALYGSIIVFDRLKQTDRAQNLCQTYVTQYPQGRYVDTVGFLRGSLAYDADDFPKAIGYFEDVLRDQPNTPRKERIELILGDVKLRQQSFDEAVAAYKKYAEDYPQGMYLEQAQYRSALALVFAGKADDATAALNAYLKKYPTGAYASDAEYRLPLIKFGLGEYDQVIADCLAWQKKYPASGPRGEVLSLMGDCYAAEDKNDDAVQAYISSYKVASTPDVLNYSLFGAGKLLQKQAKWTQIIDMFQEFIKNDPDNPLVVSCISWIGRADIKLGKVDEAKQYLADTAKKYLNDPTREAVEEIISQLAQLYAHRHLPPAIVPAPATTPSIAAATASAPGASPTASTSTTAPAPVVAPAPAPDTADPAAELEASLTIPDLNDKPTAQARILYAKSELARRQRKIDVEMEYLSEIAKKFKPEDLSPFLLGQVGDYLAQEGQTDQAVEYYNQLMDVYDTSSVVDYAYNGLGQIAYNQKKYAVAEKYYGKAVDKGLAASKLKEITLGQAQTLLALNRPEDAKPFFVEVASNRAWRGEATALSVFSLGEIEMQLGKTAEANAYYQRVFVAYQKYPNIQAKAYLRSGEAFEKLGMVPEAVNTYSEMLRNPNLQSFPESSAAKQRLDQLAQK